MAFGYPIFLELAGKRAVVIGAGAVRERKPEGLLAAGCEDVVVVATAPPDRLDELEADPRVRVERRTWRAQDLDGAFVCVAWSSDPVKRDAVARAARERGVLVNVMDDIPNCDWAAPSLVRRGELAIAISTGGASPALARRLREELSRRFGEEWAEILRVLREVRTETMSRLPDLDERAARWQAALDLDEAQELVRTGREEEWRALLVARLVGEQVRA